MADPPVWRLAVVRFHLAHHSPCATAPLPLLTARPQVRVVLSTRFSHVGIVVRKDGVLCVLESMPFEGVTLCPLEQRPSSVLPCLQWCQEC